MSSTQRPQPPFAEQQQNWPGNTPTMQQPDHGEQSYQGSGRLAGKKAIITGGHSGIGRAVVIAFARKGADVLIAYLDEHDDAQDTCPAGGRSGPESGSGGWRHYRGSPLLRYRRESARGVQ